MNGSCADVLITYVFRREHSHPKRRCNSSGFFLGESPFPNLYIESPNFPFEGEYEIVPGYAR